MTSFLQNQHFDVELVCEFGIYGPLDRESFEDVTIEYHGTQTGTILIYRSCILRGFHTGQLIAQHTSNALTYNIAGDRRLSVG